MVLDEEFPFPLNTGKKIRNFHLFSRLADKHEVCYLAYGQTDSDSFRYCAEAGMRTVAVEPQVQEKSGPAFYLKLAGNLFSSLPYVVTSHRSELFRRAFQTELTARPPDVVIASWTPYAVYLDAVQKVKTVITSHNIETGIWERYYENAAPGPKKWYIGTQVGKMRSFETAAFASADAVTAVSEGDADIIRGLTSRVEVTVIDNGVDLEFFTPEGPDQTVPDRLVFTGSMDWRPNQDAAEYFVNEIFPLLRKKRPHLEAVFVGREPPRHISLLGETDGITITGTVDDIRPYMREASVYIVPLRVGGGSRLKILEAFAMKKPVVSTHVGAEGLEVTADENILLADRPADFASAVEKLLDNRPLAEELGEAGRKLVIGRYGWDQLAARMDSFLSQMVSGR